MSRSALLLALACSTLACATSIRDRAWLNEQLRDRLGASTCALSPTRPTAPVNITTDLNEAEVVRLALCHNPALQAELTRIDVALATLDESQRPANPQLTLAGPFGPLTAVATLLLPLESLWQMPQRTEAAAREADSTGEAVLMRALDLVLNARLLHVELGLAADRANIRTELAKVADEVARLAAVRVSAGETSPLEGRVLHADAQTSVDAADLATTEVQLARARLVATLALPGPVGQLVRARFDGEVTTPPSLEQLIELARSARPDVRAAHFAVAAAAARAGWERRRIVNLGALVETQWAQPTGSGLRLGGRTELPLFHQNQGGIGRAEAQLARAVAQHELVARSVILEVTVAQTQLQQATRSRHRYETEVIPSLDSALETAQLNFQTGNQPYPVVLEVLRRVSEARLRRVELIAEQRRALCELERAIGARLQHAPRLFAPEPNGPNKS